MKKISTLVVMIAALFVLPITSVQADTGTPDILSSVSPNLVQVLSKAESAETRGERICAPWWFGGGCGAWSWSSVVPTQAGWPFYWQWVPVPGSGFFVSR